MQLESVLSCTGERPDFYKDDTNKEQLNSKIHQFLASNFLNSPTQSVILKLFAENQTSLNLFEFNKFAIHVFHIALHCTNCDAELTFTALRRIKNYEPWLNVG